MGCLVHVTVPGSTKGAGRTGGCQYCKYFQMSLNSSTSWPEGPLFLLCCGVNRLIGFLSSVARFKFIAIAMGKGCLQVLDLFGAGTSPSGFYFCFFLKQASVALPWVEEDFKFPWNPSIQEILPSFRTLTNEAERSVDLPRHGATRALPQRLCLNGIGCGSVRRRRRGYRCSQRRS